MVDRVTPPVDELPSAVPDAPRRVRVPYVWILPIIVIIAGAFVAVREKLAEAERRLCEAEAEVKKNAQAGVA